MLTKREFLLSSLSAAALVAGAGFFLSRGTSVAVSEGTFEIMKTPEEWRKILTPEQYSVLREEGTEYPGTSPLLHEKRAGVFACAGCDLPLYDAANKYDSGTGWPSFDRALENAIGTTEDRTLGMLRTECHCRRCGGHLGHIFNDGPKETTGMRHCINGVSLVFHPSGAA
jgi:peptide-methionine (R)-S-oxide reductase